MIPLETDMVFEIEDADTRVKYQLIFAAADRMYYGQFDWCLQEHRLDATYEYFFNAPINWSTDNAKHLAMPNATKKKVEEIVERMENIRLFL
jgi:hypothetical protein